MNQRLSLVSLLVRDYDEAIAFYIDQLGFELMTDDPLGNGKRWVSVSPGGAGTAGLLLAKAASECQFAAVGNQSGGRVFLFLETDNFKRDYELFSARGVRFVEKPRVEEYGTVAVFEDLYGNRWDLIGPSCE